MLNFVVMTCKSLVLDTDAPNFYHFINEKLILRKMVVYSHWYTIYQQLTARIFFSSYTVYYS